MDMFNKILSTVSIAAVSAMVLIGGSVVANAATFTPKGTKLQMQSPDIAQPYNISILGDVYGAVVDLGMSEPFVHEYTFNLAQDAVVKWQIDNSDDIPSTFGIANLVAFWDDGTGTISAGTSTFMITDGAGNSLFPSNIGINDWYKTVLTAGLHTLTFLGTSLEGGSYTTEVSSISAVPLPPAALLFGTALFGIGALRRRKDKKAGVAA